MPRISVFSTCPPPLPLPRPLPSGRPPLVSRRASSYLVPIHFPQSTHAVRADGDGCLVVRGRGNVRAIRFHYNPAKYIWTRWASSRRPRAALGRLGCISLDEVEPPALPGPEWVRIETTLSGICGSDLAAD